MASGGPPPSSPPPSQPPPEPVKRPYNPGTFEQLHKPTKDVFPSNFEGARVAVQRALSNHFQVSHIINLSSSDPSGYRFGATYVGNSLLGPAEAYPVLLGDTDASGNVSAQIIHQFGERVRAKAVAQIQKSKFQTTQLSADYLGDRYTGSVTFGNIDLLKSSGIIVGHYLHRVSKCVSLGSEMVYQYGPMVPNEHMSVLSLAGRYQADKWQATGTIGGTGVHACYYRKCNDQLQMGVEFETNLRVGKCVATLGYQVDIPRADLVFRGMVDSDWSVGSALEKKLQPLPFTLAMSGLYNHVENAFRMGIAFFVG